MTEYLLEDLNPRQKEAVLHTQGPLMIVAGAGTGKTRTLTHRVAYLIREMRVAPEKILAVTFTNRAASEMKERIARMPGRTEAAFPAVGTFHSISAKILRDEIHRLGYPPDFSILTEDECLVVLDGLGIKSVTKAKKCIALISAFKNQVGETEIAPPLFSEYQTSLRERAALDFDDLILFVLRLFQEDPSLLNTYRDRFQHILVDEYQDLNPPQYRLVRLLSGRAQNLCAVGDADQAIYSFRGAHVENFLNFQKDYPGTKIVRLEQNYRSTPVILKAAEDVIQQNRNRMEKKLWTEEKSGARIRIMEVEDEKQEARWIVSKIETLLGGTSMFQHDSDRVHAGEDSKGYSFSDIAVLFRLRGQAPPLKKALEAAGIPCRLLSGERLHRRPGVRKVLPFLRFLNDPGDDAALLTILQEEIKGLGPRSLEKIQDHAKKEGATIATILHGGKTLPGIKEETCRTICALLQRLESLSDTREHDPLPDFVNNLAGTFHMDKETLKNLMVLSARRQDRPWGTVLHLFLQDLCLNREVDLFDPRAEAVTLMTMHAAKGLEFPVVFVAGLDKGLMPYERSGKLSAEEYEEERRLFHVAMTRAMKALYLLHARSRFLHGNALSGEPSPFLQDIGQTLCRLDILKNRKRPHQKENPQLGLF